MAPHDEKEDHQSESLHQLSWQSIQFLLGRVTSHGGARGKVKASLKSLGFIPWEPWIVVRSFKPIHPISIFQTYYTAKKTWPRFLHCSNLYELLKQNGSFHQVFTEAQLGHHPVLHLIEATHKPLQVSCDAAWELMTAEYVVDELHLERHGQWVTSTDITCTHCEKENQREAGFYRRLYRTSV